MASFFTRALDTITPWNRKGEVQRRAQAKKKKDQEQGNAPQLGLSPGEQLNQNSQPRVQRPENLFQGLSENLKIGQPKQPVTVAKTPDTQPVSTPTPGTIVKPKQGFLDKVRDQFDANTEADRYRRAQQDFQDTNEKLVRTGVDPNRARDMASRIAKSNMRTPETNTTQSDLSIAARSAGSVGSNVAGGVLGILKGTAQLPSAVLSAPKLARVGVAKLTKNKQAEENALNDNGTLTRLANRYDRFVSPVVQPLTTAETATDKTAGDLAPWAPGYVKPTAKVLTNIIPVEAMASGLARLSRARNLEKVIKKGKPVKETTDAVGTATGGLKKIPVRTVADVADEVGNAVDIPVRNVTPKGAPIREIGGDAPGTVRIPTPAEAAVDKAANRFQNQPFPRPDDRIEGITPRDPAAPGVVTEAQVADERAALDAALANKEINKTEHKQANKALDETQTVDGQPKGAKIEVKQVDSLPVQDKTIVPTGLPEAPGTVRATTSAEPMEAKTAAVAAQTPPPLPVETQRVLDNPKQFNKRQVAAARNQAKMAKAKAKADEQTAEALSRIESASPAAQSGEGFVPTGEFAKSQKGGTYQKTSRQAEMQQAVQETSQMSPADVIQTARRNQAETGGFNRRDIRNVAALFETKRIPRGTPEYDAARQILKEDGTVWGQIGALRNYTMRRTASADELVSRYESKIYRLAEDPTKIDSKLFDDVEVAENAYTAARDDALIAYNRFTESPTSANAKAYHVAQDAADEADKAAKITEYKVAHSVLKGNKDIKQVRELEKMANEADMYQMDAVDASMLSGTGTFVRNLMNAGVGGVEEGLFGKAGAFISRKLTGEAVGGGIGRGSIKGFKEGAANVVDASKARAGNAGKNPLEHIKNWATTGNQLGDSVIDSQTIRNTFDHYTQVLKEQGYTGRELRDRASTMARQDPDEVGRMYATAARTAAGLGAGITRGNKIETIFKNIISDSLSNVIPLRASEPTAKLITRMTIGFPTAIGRSTAEGAKRFSLGAPTFIKAIRTPDPAARALLIKEGVKQAGTGGLVLPPLFYALGANDLITGAYPTDKEERARWEREGISENSVKLGGAYYQLPAYLGAWALPGLFYASLGRNDGDFGKAAADAAKTIPAVLPTDNISSWLDVINGRSDPGKFTAQTAASAVRAATPGGALLNELAKSFDPTKNDTNSNDTNIANFVDKVLSGIPGASNTLPDKKDDGGNVIKNPNPAQLLMGAASAVQGKGEARSAELQTQVDSSAQKMSDAGALDDPNLKGVLDDSELQIYNKVKSGEKVDAKDLKKLQDALVKGVSQTGDDTAYLEREQYDSNLAALKLKKQLMEADKSVKPSDVKKVDMAIKRGQIYKDGEIPYEMIDAYQTTGVDEWRKMGDPESDSYDPEMYQKLWDIDEKLAKSGVSYKKGSPEKQKYSAKQSKGGKGSRGGSNFSSEFGTLKAGKFAPDVQAYDTLDQKSGSVPSIRRTRSNIVHKISSS